MAAKAKNKKRTKSIKSALSKAVKKLAGSPTKKPTAKKPAAKKPATKKPTPKKTAPKKAVAKKPIAKKPAPKKPTAKKPAPKKAAPKKPATKKATAKKPAPKKTAPKKAVAKKPAPKKASPKKPAPKKAVAKKPTPKKATPKKPAPKKAAPKKATPPPTPKATTPKATPKPPSAKPKIIKVSMTKREGSAAGRTPVHKKVKRGKNIAPITLDKKQVSGFRARQYIVYPAHGVGQISEIVEQNVAGHKLQFFVVSFEKEKMTLRVPTDKAKHVGMRSLADSDTLAAAMKTLRGRARIRRTMWSRRAQEYEAKINSGNLIAVAEVVRDLYRASHQPDQSYSERQLYEAALERMSREIAIIEQVSGEEAIILLETALSKAIGVKQPAE